MPKRGSVAGLFPCSVGSTIDDVYAIGDGVTIWETWWLSRDELADASERWRGMLPQFLPFARNPEGIVGFYAAAGVEPDRLPILQWDSQHDSYLPVASSLEAYLRVLLVQQAYDALEAPDDTTPAERDVLGRFAVICQMDPAGMKVPSTELTMLRMLRDLDPGCSHNWLRLACSAAGAGDATAALAKVRSAQDAMPWHGDPHFMAAELGPSSECVPALRRVLECPIVLSTHTGRYDLGPLAADQDIYECTVGRLTRLVRDPGDDAVLAVSLGEETFSPNARWELSGVLEQRGDVAGAERELLNGLTLALEEDAIAEAYDRMVEFLVGAGREWEAACCRADAVRDA